MVTDITNWRDPGHNVWGFQNADKIVPTETISKASSSSSHPSAAPLKSELRAFDAFKVQLSDQESLDLPSFLARVETDGLVVIQDGVIVLEHYDRTNTETSIHATFSISKSVTGLVCGILAHQGVLNADALVSDYVPEVKGSAYQDKTVRQLLDMRAGIEHDDGSPDYREATGLYPPKRSADQPPIDLHTYIPSIQSPAVPAIAGEPTSKHAGPPFQYVSPNADLLGWVVERASGKKFAQVLSESIWQPMGAESDAYITVDRSGNARAAAGLCATVRDLARLGQVILEGGRRIVPSAWVEDMLSGGSEAAFAAGSEKKDYDRIFETVAYRSFWVASPTSRVLMASGTNGQLLVVDCKNGTVMAKTSSQPQRTDWEKIALTMRAFGEFTRLSKLEG